MKTCFVPDCTHVQGKDNCSVHRFPRTPKRFRRWVRLVRRGDRLPNNHDVVCGCHFRTKSNTPSKFKRNAEHVELFKSPPGKRKLSRIVKRLLGPDEQDLIPQSPRTNLFSPRCLMLEQAGPARVGNSSSRKQLLPSSSYGSEAALNREDSDLAVPLEPLEGDFNERIVRMSADSEPVDADLMQDTEIPVDCEGNPHREDFHPGESTPEEVSRSQIPASTDFGSFLASHTKALSEGRKITRTVRGELEDLREKVKKLNSQKEKSLGLKRMYERELSETVRENKNLQREKCLLGSRLEKVNTELERMKKYQEHLDERMKNFQEVKERAMSKINELETLSAKHAGDLHNTTFQLNNCLDEKERCREDALNERKRLGIDNILNSDKRVKHYTGLPNANTFQWLLSLFENYTFSYYTGKNVVILSRGDQLFMTLMFLRRGFSRQEQADWFNVSTQTVMNVTNTWIDALHTVLFKGFMSEVPSLCKNQASLPKCFEKFRNCRIILDCTEVRCAIPGTIKLHNFVYSNYKHYTTLKGLLGIAPNGTPTFASKLYPGSTSDKAIVKDCGVLNVLKSGESVMVDKGFLISEMLPEGVEVTRPPFLVTPQFTSDQVVKSKDISEARVHVERAIRRIKTYKILTFIPSSMVQYASKIWQVCVALTTLMPPLLKEVQKTMVATRDFSESDDE